MGKEETRNALAAKYNEGTITFEESKELIQLLMEESARYLNAYSYRNEQMKEFEAKVEALQVIVNSMFPR